MYCFSYYSGHTIADKKIKTSEEGIVTAIPRDMLPLDMLTPQIRHYELWQKNSRYANLSDFFTPSYAIFYFVEKNSRYANFSALFTPSYAIMNCVQKLKICWF